MATLVVNTGKAIVTNRLKGAGTEPLNAGWGTGAGTTGATDTDLFTAASESRVAGTSTQQTTSTTNDTYQVVATIVAGGSKTITNAGLFDGLGSGNPPSGANLFLKGDFTGIALSANDSISFTFKVQFQ